MTLAVANPTPTQPTGPTSLPIAILGTDALLAALPATPVQLAHACVAAGFTNVIPASWGDELIAAAVLRRLPHFGSGPAIQCSCPIVAHRLLTVGGDLRSVLLAFVPPPVAAARYVRAIAQPAHTRITYVGSCPGAIDDSIDIRITPASFIAMLAERRISLTEQPHVFESVLPPDRRRFRSQPGGLPAADVLWGEVGGRTIAELDGDDLVIDVAQLLLTGKNVLIDPSVRLGCVCSGAAVGVSPPSARERVVANEPPRATMPVVEERLGIELQLVVPAFSRSPIDVMAVPAGSAAPHLLPSAATPEASVVRRTSPLRGVATVAEPRLNRPSGPIGARALAGVVPHSRDVEGKSLPRAYVARRRSSPRGIPAVTLSTDELSFATAIRGIGARARATLAPVSSPPPARRTNRALSVPWPIGPRQVVYLTAGVVALVIIVSAAVSIVVGRSLSAPPATVSHQP